MVKIEQTGGRLTEEEILHGKEDAYGIYQVNRKGAGRDYAFLSFDSLRSKGKVPERTEYQLVYSDILGADENRDSLFTKFNIAHPDDFTGHSLSVSDIILIKRNGKVNVSYVDMIGFVPLPDFYKEPSLRVVEQITESTKGFTAEGHFGTWHSIQMQEFHNEKFFQMRHDEFGKQVADIIVNEQGQVIAEDLWHGFSPEAMKLIGEYLLDKSLHDKKEAAYILSADKGYFLIHETDEGYDYTFYDQEYQELDGGIYDNLDVSLKEAIEDILNDAGETIENIKETDYEKLEQEIEEAEEAGLLESVIQESKRRLQEGDVALTSEVYYEEKSLNGMSRADIEEIVLSQAQIILDELGLHDEVELIGARVYGSLQLSLFPENPQEQAEYGTAAGNTPAAVFAFPDNYIDECLRTGGNNELSLEYVLLDLAQENPQKILAKDLKENWKGGKGLAMPDGIKVSVWYNEEGISFRRGNGARKNPERLLSWEEAAERIEILYRNGQFTTRELSENAISTIREETAGLIAFFYKEDIHDFQE